METKPLRGGTTRSKWMAGPLTAHVRTLLPLLLCTLSAAVQAQFAYSTGGGTVTITKYTGPGGAVTVPDTTNGLPVTSIGGMAFFGCDSVTNVTIPNTVISVGENAFNSCTGLTAVTIPTSVTAIGRIAFADCGLTSLTIPGTVSTLEGSAFSYCTSLTNVMIADGVTTIQGGAFKDCTALISVTIPNSIKLIEGRRSGWMGAWAPGAFDGCTSLKAVYFGGNAQAGTHAFEGAEGATMYYLPGTVGWGPTFDGRPTALWERPHPVILDFVTNFGVRTNGFGFVISWATNAAVAVEACTDLAQPVWSPVSTNILTGGTACFSDADWVRHPDRFYRVRSP